MRHFTDPSFAELVKQPPVFQDNISPVPFAQKVLPSFSYQLPSIAITEKINIDFVLEDPLIITFSNFISPLECQELIESARSRLSPSTIVPTDKEEFIDGGNTRKSESGGMSICENSIVYKIEARIAQITNTRIEQGEFLQVLRYGEGGEYVPHYDYFNNCSESFIAPDRGGQRLATLIIYLNNVEEGGATEFPSLGVRCNAIAGNACYFNYVNSEGKMDPRSLHAGLPVLKGEKWVAVKWIREVVYHK